MKMWFRRFQNSQQKPNFVFVFVLFFIMYWLYSQTSHPNLINKTGSPAEDQKLLGSRNSLPNLMDGIQIQEDETTDPCYNINGLQADEPKLITCLRKKYLNPPSLQEYNLANSTILNPSEFKQNILVLQLLRNKKNGLFIEAGALDGELMSNTLYLERKFRWTGLLIEPDAVNYVALMSKHRKSWTSNSCLSLKNRAEKLTLVGTDYYGPKGGLIPVKNSKTQKRFPADANYQRPPQEVQCFPLYTYFLALGITEVDYFSLDIEKGDFEVLKTIPFDKVIFKVVQIATYWADQDEAAVHSYLQASGYIFVKKVDVDSIFVHESLKLYLMNLL